MMVPSDGPRGGSHFTAPLPTLVEPNAAPHIPVSTAESPQATPRRRILVVDDNRDAATSLAMILRLMGHETRIAHDGIECVEVATAYQPDIIFLDIGMPRMNGYDACRAIRELPYGTSIFMVALTGWGQAEDRRKAKEAGFDEHLTKPADPDVLGKLLAEFPSFKAE